MERLLAGFRPDSLHQPLGPAPLGGGGMLWGGPVAGPAAGRRRRDGAGCAGQAGCPGAGVFPGRQYYERKRREGKIPKEALRCLKRRLSDLVYYQLLADRRGTIEACGSPTTPPPTRPTSTSPRPRSRRAAPPSKRPAGHRRVHRAGLERRPPRRHRDPRRQHLPPPRPPRPSRHRRLKRQPLDREEPLGAMSPHQAATGCS